jgi:hypothetical protein
MYFLEHSIAGLSVNYKITYQLGVLLIIDNNRMLVLFVSVNQV